MTHTANRRDVLTLVAMLGTLPAMSFAQQQRVLPLDTPGLDHLDVIVPDVEKSARFYMGLFRTVLHAQPFQGGQRYFVLLGPLPENRTVGYIAIGAARGRGTYVGHFCTSVVNWRENSNAVFAKMKEEFRTAGFGEFPGGTGVAGTFKDPDGIEIQFLPSPDTLVTAAVPSDLVPSQQGLVVPQRVDSVLVRVSNLDKALQFYRTLYGKEASRNATAAQFNFRNGSRLMLEQVSYVYDGGGPVRIARFGILVKPFDRAAVAAAIPQLGGKVVKDDGKVLRLTDADGIELELATAQ
jgi:catechol 2,3-dioxygenase-like lactoylglutathione lyase family enzyme